MCFDAPSTTMRSGGLAAVAFLVIQKQVADDVHVLTRLVVTVQGRDGGSARTGIRSQPWAARPSPGSRLYRERQPRVPCDPPFLLALTIFPSPALLKPGLSNATIKLSVSSEAARRLQRFQVTKVMLTDSPEALGENGCPETVRQVVEPRLILALEINKCLDGMPPALWTAATVLGPAVLHPRIPGLLTFSKTPLSLRVSQSHTPPYAVT